MKEALQCAVVDCKLPPMAGQVLCADHKPKPLTLRERIAKGPRFDEDTPDRDGARCVCGDGVTVRDKLTSLCRPCWRAWRWSSIREYEQP